MSVKPSPAIEYNTGFEFEFASPYDHNRVAEKLPARGHNALRVDRQNRVWDGSNTVFITHDGSIEAPVDYHKIEVVTSPRPLNESIYEMGQILSFMQESGAVTNDSTGLHIGVSFVNPLRQQSLNPIKMLYHLPEDELLIIWNRKGNRYCKALKGRVIDQLVSGHVGDTASAKITEWPTIRDLVINMGRNEAKYYSANLLKLAAGYVEFRFMGGRDYHTKTAQILRSTKMVLNAMAAGVDPTRDQEGYNKWIKGMHVASWKQNVERKKSQLLEHRRVVTSIEASITQLQQLINN